MTTGSSWTVASVPALSGLTIEWADSSQLLMSRGRHLYRGSFAGVAERVASFPEARWRRPVSRFRLGRRLLRATYYNAVPVKQDICFVTFDRQVAWAERGRVRRIATRNRSFRVLRSGCAQGASGAMYFGEYVDNAERATIHIFGAAPGDVESVVAWQFPAGEIRHVHGIYRDWVDGSLWVTTGDRGGECRILRTTDEFRTLESLGGGDETWRSVSLQFTPDAIWYGTDAEFRPNHLVRIDRRTGARDFVQRVGGTVFYSTRAGDSCIFGTTTEHCAGNPDSIAHLWSVTARGCEVIQSARSDRWAGRVFQFGQFLLPRKSDHDNSPRFLFHGMGLSGMDRWTFVASPAASAP